MVEVGKLTANVDRLIDDVKSQGGKLDEIRHQISFLKGAIWVGGGAVAVAITIAGFFLSAKWDAALALLKVAIKAP
jgi:hypothetical protein